MPNDSSQSLSHNPSRNLSHKSSVDAIRHRFDNDVERFSNLQTGQSATIDAPLALDLIVSAAAAATPHATHSLDVGSGAGNYTLKLLEALPDLNVDLVDLSAPMLARAAERLAPVARGSVRTVQADIREVPLKSGAYDIVVAAATLHHLRTHEEWQLVFEKLFLALRPGGSFWISDLVLHDLPAVQAVMWQRYGDYLVALKGEEYRDHVFDYIEQEDSPRSLTYQLDLLRRVGFVHPEVLHKNGPFAGFGAVKPAG